MVHLLFAQKCCHNHNHNNNTNNKKKKQKKISNNTTDPGALPSAPRLPGKLEGDARVSLRRFHWRRVDLPLVTSILSER